MNSQPKVYSKNKPGFIKKVVNCGFTKMNKGFGGHLKDKMDEAGLNAAELSRRSGVTKQNIGRLLNNTPHSITGALPTTEPPTVEKLARALNWEVDEALKTAGFAPLSESTENSFDLIEGVKISFPANHLFSDEDKKSIAQTFRIYLRGMMFEPRAGHISSAANNPEQSKSVLNPERIELEQHFDASVKKKQKR